MGADLLARRLKGLAAAERVRGAAWAAAKVRYFVRRVVREAPMRARLLPSAAERAAAAAAGRPDDPEIAVLVPVYGTPLPLLDACVRSVVGQTHRNWILCLADGSDDAQAGARAERLAAWAASDPRIRVRRLERNLGIAGNTNAALALSDAPYAALLDHDDLLAPTALSRVAAAFRDGADVAYTDEAVFVGTPRRLRSLHLKPDLAPDTLRSHNYVCHFLAFRRALVADGPLLDPALDGSQDYDLALRLAERAARVVHVPEALYFWRIRPGSTALDLADKPYCLPAAREALARHLRRLGLDGTVSDGAVPSTYRIRYALPAEPAVAVLASRPTDPGEPGLDPAALRAATEGATLAFPADLRAALDGAPDGFVLFLDPALRPLSPDWAASLARHAQRPGVGAVGAKLLSADRKVASAGLVVAPRFRLLPIHRGDAAAFDGALSRLTFATDLTALPLACLLVRRDVLAASGWPGPGAFAAPDAAAADLCLRLRDRGLWNVCDAGVVLADRRPLRGIRRAEARRAAADGGRILRGTGDRGSVAVSEADAARLAVGRPGLAAFADPFHHPLLDARRATFTLRLPPRAKAVPR